MLGQNGAVRLGCYVEMGEEIIVPWLWIQLGDFFQDHPGKWLVGWVNMANQPDTRQKDPKFLAGERKINPIDTKRLVRISFYPSKIDLVKKATHKMG